MSSVEAARSLGVGMVHQEFSVVDDLTLAENLVLGIEPVRRGTLDLAAIESATSGLEARTGWKLPWDRPARRCRRRRSQPLRTAPPTASGLGSVDPRRADGGARAGRRRSTAGDDGRAARRPAGRSCSSPTSWARCIRVADDVTVLKGGEVVWSGPAADTERRHRSPGRWSGPRSRHRRSTTPRRPGSVILETSGLTVVDERGALRLDHVDLTVAGGEVVAVYGVAGSGQRQLVEAIIGLTPAGGTVRLAGVDISDRPPAERRRAGLSYISPDRRHEGLALGEPVLANVVAGQQRRPQFSRRGVIVADAWRRRFDRVAKRYRVVAGRTGDARRNAVRRQPAATRRRARARSGSEDRHRVRSHAGRRHPRGERHPSLHPRDARCPAAPCCLVSHELDEVLALADRVLVLMGGTIVGELDRAEADRGSIAELMTMGRAS